MMCETRRRGVKRNLSRRGQPPAPGSPGVHTARREPSRERDDDARRAPARRHALAPAAVIVGRRRLQTSPPSRASGNARPARRGPGLRAVALADAQNFYKTMGTPKVFRGMAALMPALRNWTDAAFATEGGAYREATLDNVELGQARDARRAS